MSVHLYKLQRLEWGTKFPVDWLGLGRMFYSESPSLLEDLGLNRGKNAPQSNQSPIDTERESDTERKMPQMSNSGLCTHVGSSRVE